MWLFNRLAVARAGGKPERLCPGDPVDPERYDGFVIGGGDDIDATLYDGVLQPTVRIDPERDALELELLENATARGRPILGICRGAQMINVFLGGSLHANIHDVYSGVPRRKSALPAKRVTISAGSILRALLRHDRVKVNALHHQSIDRLGAGLHIVARDDYGIVQAVEDPSRRFLLGVQWHPEFLIGSKGQQRLFAALVAAAQEDGARAGPRAARAGAAAYQGNSVPS
jgi:putative glutamine amidotransferase